MSTESHSSSFEVLCTGFGASTSEYIPEQLLTLDGLKLLLQIFHRAGINCQNLDNDTVSKVIIYIVAATAKEKVAKATHGTIDMFYGRHEEFSALLLAVKECFLGLDHPEVKIEPINKIETTVLFQKIISDVRGCLSNPDGIFFRKFCPPNQVLKIRLEGGDQHALMDYAIWEIATILYYACCDPPQFFVSHEKEAEYVKATKSLTENILCISVYNALKAIHSKDLSAVASQAEAVFPESEANDYQKKHTEFEAASISLEDYRLYKYVTKLAVLAFQVDPVVMGYNCSVTEFHEKYGAQFAGIANQLLQYIDTDDMGAYMRLSLVYESMGLGASIRGKGKAHYDINGGPNWDRHNIFLGRDDLDSSLGKFEILTCLSEDLIPEIIINAITEEFDLLKLLEGKSLQEYLSKRSNSPFVVEALKYLNAEAGIDSMNMDCLSDIELQTAARKRIKRLRGWARNYLKDIVAEVIVFKRKLSYVLEDSYFPGMQSDHSADSCRRSDEIELLLEEARLGLSSTDQEVVAGSVRLILELLDDNVLRPFNAVYQRYKQLG